MCLLLAACSDDGSGTGDGETNGSSTSDTSNGTTQGGSATGGGGSSAGGSDTGSSGGVNSANNAANNAGGTLSSGGASSSSATNTTDGDAGGAGGTGGSAGTPGVDPPPSCEAPDWDATDFATVYDVGPDQDYATPSDVPWESLTPGTLIRIHRRDTPYADKWVISVAATAEAPVVVLGVPSDGKLPEIVGDGAITRSELDYWSGTRGIIKIGGSSVPDLATASHVFVECLDLSGARGSFSDEDGAQSAYDDNASAVFLESGQYITLRNNVFHDSGNGLFVAHASDHIVVSGNQLFDNGNTGSIYEHNSYTEARGITFEFNRYGELCDGCDGNNLKDRSSGLVVRYNWIEGGNRALDLVDSEYEDINGATDYDDSFVYGNVLIERDGGNRQMVHYGGDNSEEYFRTGTLHFFHNTVVSERNGLATIVRLSSSQANVDARNNIVYAAAGGDQIGFLEDVGSAVLSGNWLPTGWQLGSPSFDGDVSATDNHEGSDPGFEDAAAENFHLKSDAEARGITVPLATAASEHTPAYQFAAPASGLPRTSTLAAGAFE